MSDYYHVKQKNLSFRRQCFWAVVHTSKLVNVGSRVGNQSMAPLKNITPSAKYIER